MTEVVGTNAAGIGVSGSGSTYGVYGTSTGDFAGVVAKNGPNSTAPGLYAQTDSPAPGVLAISGTAGLLDALFSTNLDAAAIKWGQQYPNQAGLFIGDVALTGALTGAQASFTGSLKVTGAVTGATCVYQGGASTAVKGVNGAGSGQTPKFGCGAWGDSAQGYGVYGASVSASGVYGTSKSGLAGEFVGNVSVTGNLTASGDLSAKDVSATGDVNVTGDVGVTGTVSVKGDIILTGADCAEQFDLSADELAEPGTVMVIDEAGALRASSKAYDRAVAGVVSGAGTFRPGVILDQRPGDPQARAPIALVGKVYCKVDADAGAITVGDLLTTADRPGHAMKAADPLKGVGAVIGKALGSLQAGQGLLPILVSLQ